MPLPTLTPATQTPIWQAMIAWFASAGTFFGCTASTTVNELKRAFLAADKPERARLYVALGELECIVRRLLMAAALAMPMSKSNAPPSRAKPASNSVPSFSTLNDESDDEDKPSKPYKLDVPPTVLIEDTDAWLPHTMTAGEKLVDDDAEDFARRYLSLGRLLANPDSAIRKLAQRFNANRRRARDDVMDCNEALQDRHMSSRTWPEPFETAHTLFLHALNTFDIFAEPG